MSDRRVTGDAWVETPDGRRYWGRFGAAGLLAYDRGRDAILLQHRVTWSHFGDTWGIPGGARHQHESAIDGAVRESQEEAGVPDAAVSPSYTHRLDLGVWSYTTVIADVVTPFEPRITDPESHALAWVPCDRVTELDLHPGFAASWPTLRPLLGGDPVVVVDSANVVGSVPDGWWKDRRAAAERLRDRLELLSSEGVRSGLVGLPRARVPGLDRAYPEWVQVTEGAARELSSSTRVRVVGAPEIADDTIVAEVTRLTALGRRVTVVTSDADLIVRVLAAGAANTRGAGALVKRLPRLPDAHSSE